ncbi:MAG TPA: hypothetical protein DIT87_04785, partial [Clostridiales bacterium]|nr:hypothetical protein [Clostridiales bacterium]
MGERLCRISLPFPYSQQRRHPGRPPRPGRGNDPHDRPAPAGRDPLPGGDLYAGSASNGTGGQLDAGRAHFGGLRMEEKLHELLSAVSPLDESAMEKARERQAQLAKPPGSLGRLEDLSVQLAGITGRVHNQMEKTHLLIFAADNGVVAEGVSSAPQSVTLMQTVNLTRGKTGASVLARHFGSGITVCDVGVNADIRDKAVLNRKIAYGT